MTSQDVSKPCLAAFKSLSYTQPHYHDLVAPFMHSAAQALTPSIIYAHHTTSAAEMALLLEAFIL